MANERLLASQHVSSKRLCDTGFTFEHGDIDSAFAAMLGPSRDDDD